jgi:hypothetical protein
VIAMPKYTVDDVLEIIRDLSPEEKASLKAQLATVLEAGSVSSATQQTQSLAVGGNFQVGGRGNVADFSQRQTVGNTAPELGTEEAASAQALLHALTVLQQQILNSADLNTVEKATAKVPIATVAEELKKDKPDKDLIDQSVEALRKGLAGVETLAEPVMRVAALVAKAVVLL